MMICRSELWPVEQVCAPAIFDGCSSLPSIEIPPTTWSTYGYGKRVVGCKHHGCQLRQLPTMSATRTRRYFVALLNAPGVFHRHLTAAPFCRAVPKAEPQQSTDPLPQPTRRVIPGRSRRQTSGAVYPAPVRCCRNRQRFKALPKLRRRHFQSFLEATPKHITTFEADRRCDAFDCRIAGAKTATCFLKTCALDEVGRGRAEFGFKSAKELTRTQASFRGQSFYRQILTEMTLDPGGHVGQA